MKTLRLIGMALVAVIMSVNFVSCSDDDEDESGNAASLVGTWKVTKTIWNSGEEEDGDEHDYPYWVISSNTIYCTDKIGGEIEGDYCSYTYDAEKKIVYLTYIDDGRDGGTLTIIKLTSNELVYNDGQRTDYCKRVK